MRPRPHPCTGDEATCRTCAAAVDAAETGHDHGYSASDWQSGQDAYERELDRRWGE